MKLYRLQSEKYNIDSTSRSYVWGYESWFHAALEDCQEFEQLQGIQVEGNEQLIEKTWYELLESTFTQISWYRTKAENGVSCFQTLEELYKYFFADEERISMDFYCNNYILEFEGEADYYGHDNEIIAQYQKELGRMTVSEMVEKFEGGNC